MCCVNEKISSALSFFHIEFGDVTTVGLKSRKSSAAHANRVYSNNVHFVMYRTHSHRPFWEDSS